MVDSLVGFLRNRSAMVVLDNCEHLIDACAELAERLVTSGARLRLLVTSREPLRVPGEVQLRGTASDLPAAGHHAGAAAATTTPPGCSSTEPSTSGLICCSMRRPPPTLAGSAGSWTAYRWRWNWPQPGWRA